MFDLGCVAPRSLRMLCSKVCVDLMGSSVHSILEPGDDPDRVLVLIDLANAFNCVLRGAVLSAVRTHFPLALG